MDRGIARRRFRATGDGNLSVAATTSPITAIDYTPAGELKIGQVGIANLRVRTLDVAQLGSEMRERVARAPKLFGRAAVVVDFGGLAQMPDVATARALLDSLREAGVLPVALAWGSSDNEQLAVQLGLPLLAKFRAQYEPAQTAAVGAASAAGGSTSIAAEAAPANYLPSLATSARSPACVSGAYQASRKRSFWCPSERSRNHSRAAMAPSPSS